MNKYKVLIEEINSDTSYELEIETDNLEWSMEQYQRNREPLTYTIKELISSEEISKALNNLSNNNPWIK